MEKILILGKGRIGRAIEHYLKKTNPSLKVSFLSEKSDVKKYNLLIGALPGKIGEQSFKLALKFKKDLIDVSDSDPLEYFKFNKEIRKKGIRVIPECGFSPGLTNLVCGNEAKKGGIKELEILAGTLSKRKFYFPFTWCFEDLIFSQKLKPVLIKKGKKIKADSFSGLRLEKIEGITAESYFSQGLSSLPENLKIDNMSYRILRPLGFFNFIRYLESYGFLSKKNFYFTPYNSKSPGLDTGDKGNFKYDKEKLRPSGRGYTGFTKKILESKKEDNLTVSLIKLKKKDREIFWKIKSFSKKREKLNSMQKIAGLMPAVMAQLLFQGKIKENGILFMEKIGEDENLFKDIIKRIRKEKILIKKTRGQSRD